MAVGYSTLYGDTAGGFAVIKDVPKLLVYELCRCRNAGRGPGRSSRRRCSSSRRRPSCGPTSATTRACRPTRCSTRSSRPTSRSDRAAGEIVAAGYDPDDRRADHPAGRPGRVQAAPDRPRRACHRQGASARTGACRSRTATAADARVAGARSPFRAVTSRRARAHLPPRRRQSVGCRRSRGGRHRGRRRRPVGGLLLGRAATVLAARRLDRRDPRAGRQAGGGRARRPPAWRAQRGTSCCPALRPVPTPRGRPPRGVDLALADARQVASGPDRTVEKLAVAYRVLFPAWPPRCGPSRLGPCGVRAGGPPPAGDSRSTDLSTDWVAGERLLQAIAGQTPGPGTAGRRGVVGGGGARRRRRNRGSDQHRSATRWWGPLTGPVS